MIQENLTDGYLLVKEDFDFYKILEAKSDITVIDEIGEMDEVAVLGKLEAKSEQYTLSRIITSPMRDNSDIIYLYTHTEKVEGE